MCCQAHLRQKDEEYWHMQLNDDGKSFARAVEGEGGALVDEALGALAKQILDFGHRVALADQDGHRLAALGVLDIQLNRELCRQKDAQIILQTNSCLRDITEKIIPPSCRRVTAWCLAPARCSAESLRHVMLDHFVSNHLHIQSGSVVSNVK